MKCVLIICKSAVCWVNSFSSNIPVAFLSCWLLIHAEETYQHNFLPRKCNAMASHSQLSLWALGGTFLFFRGRGILCSHAASTFINTLMKWTVCALSIYPMTNHIVIKGENYVRIILNSNLQYYMLNKIPVHVTEMAVRSDLDNLLLPAGFLLHLLLHPQLRKGTTWQSNE